MTRPGLSEVVVIAADEFRRLKGNHAGQALIDAIQSSPCGETNIEPERMVLAVRNVLRIPVDRDRSFRFHVTTDSGFA